MGVEMGGRAIVTGGKARCEIGKISHRFVRVGAHVNGGPSARFVGHVLVLCLCDWVLFATKSSLLRVLEHSHSEREIEQLR